MSSHARLSASSSHRWINCPPSVLLCESIPETAGGSNSTYAQEGTDAHALCEHKLLKALGRDTTDPTPKLTHYCTEMEDCAEGYVAFVLELLETAKRSCVDPIIFVEERLDFGKYVDGGFGTGDCVIIADDTLHIVDYKHGVGVPVAAEENPQMMIYGLSALEQYDGIYNIDTVSMSIYQPRRNNVSTFTMTAVDLKAWATEVLQPAAILAHNGEGEFKCGEWCRFCRAKNTCRARAEEVLSLALYDFQPPAMLTDEEISDILTKLDPLVSWAGDIKEHAYKAALSGKRWTGWKLVEGISKRRYTDEAAVAQAVTAAGFDPYDQKLKPLTAMEKTLGKSKFHEVLGALVEKPAGKPTLVPSDDKRPEINTATADFTEI